MYRLISFIVIFSFVSIMLYYHNLSGHHLTASGHKSHSSHQTVLVPKEGPVPSITGKVRQDPTGSWLLKVETKNFTFTPEKVGQNTGPFNEGHAHIYLNGEKINRLYGNYYNLDILEPGTYEIKVSLNSNNHETLFYQGKEIAFEQTIKVERP